jgi:hypothetical protein
VVVRPVEPRAWDALLQPAHQRLVPDVHPQGDLRLAAVPAEVAVSYEQAHDEPFLERGEAYL